MRSGHLFVLALALTMLIYAIGAGPAEAKVRDFATLSEFTKGGDLHGSNELISKASALDDETVLYEGEVIGDIMRRGDHAWVNVHDGKNAIGVFLTAEQAKLLTQGGDYKDVGDRVIVKGEFHRACPVHGGELDIHADTLFISDPGQRIAQQLDLRLLVEALVLVFVTLLLFVLSHFRHHEEDETEETLI